ncbi:MAG: type III-B CRISPR module RAMP protein Cmr6 [candidate division WOR-3 bacterium]
MIFENFNLYINKNTQELVNVILHPINKKKFFEKLIKGYFKFKEGSERLRNFIKEEIDSLKSQNFIHIFGGQLTTSSRLIVGLGSSHVLETSITLHHIYGIPYIPSSALKGVCRRLSFWKIAENKNVLNNEKELSKIQNEFYGELSFDKEILKYQLLFGAQNFKGLLLFLDAYPVIENNREIFDLDIMNVHYQKYYSDATGKIPPGDWENPNPIIFLTLKEGIKFNFNVLYDKWRATRIKESEEKELKELKIPEYAKEIVNNWESNTQELENEIKKLIEEALKEFGVGAKTRVGYGIFEYV